ncbi:MAG TPA: DUF1598 domain-containing protein, partial [Pirellulales bacterium]|nr:DUF1598 domain-containing protein [Pirellulales bacterium]
ARRSESTGISCSIDPTPDGLTNLRHFASSLRALTGDTAEQIERVLGPQVISITGVPASSHFALVLVAADYRMKRIGMHLDTSPVDGLKSYLEMITVAGRGVQSLTPRWWLVPRYAPLLTNAAGTAWELRGGSVEAMTEDTLFSNDGSKAQTGKSSPAAAQWAKSFTARYDELSAKDPIFARLRNCMDFAVVAALMAKEHLAEKAGCSFSLLTDPTQLPANEYEAPRTTASKVSVVRRPSGYVVSASGGVEIRPYEVIEKTEQSAALDPVRGSAAPAANARWWWN